MSQKQIKSYFPKLINSIEESNISDSSGDECVNLQLGSLKYYEDLLKKKDEVKKVAKIVVSPCGISECWKYFGDLFIKDHKVLEKFKFCKMCFEGEKMALKSFAKSTSTTNYNNHLRLVHELDLKSINYKKTSLMTQSALNDQSANKTKFQNARVIAEMCCWDLQPFKLVERPGFKKFVNFLSPKMVLPSDRTIATAALKDVYDTYMQHVKTVLSAGPSHMTLVLDMWTDKYKHLSYINIKVHFCEDFNFKIVTLKTEMFSHPHTGLAVAQKIDLALSEFNLQGKTICAVTDGGSNIVNALKRKNITRYGCIAHCLHRFLMHDILNNKHFHHINTIVIKLKSIYRSLMYSSEEIMKLQNLEEQSELFNVICEAKAIMDSLECDEQFPNVEQDIVEQIEGAMHSSHNPSLKNSVPTRWNSLLVMIKSFLKNSSIINIALLKVKEEPQIIPEMEKQIVEEFGNYLQIFEESTRYLQGQEYPTISCCIYFYEQVMSSLQTVEDSSCFDLLIQLCNFGKENFGKRYKIYKIHVVAALMDPCQKNWPVLENYLKKIPKNASSAFELKSDVEFPISKEEILLEEINKISNGDTEIQQPCTSQAALEQNRKKQKISNTRQQMLDFLSTSSCNTVHNPLELEIKKYFDTKVFESETIDWWKQHKEIFPNIEKLANVCFGIPATSASSEQAFSVAGNCINEKRSQINPITLKQQLFIHDNKKIVELFLSKTKTS